MVRFILDPAAVPEPTDAERARLAAMTDGEITAAAADDPDNPELTEAELARIAAARHVRQVRIRTGMSQARFAAAFRINLGRLRDLEQGRTRPDTALLAYLDVIDQEPEAVGRALGAAGSS